jgi:hypothetical protein
MVHGFSPSLQVIKRMSGEKGSVKKTQNVATAARRLLRDLSGSKLDKNKSCAVRQSG